MLLLWSYLVYVVVAIGLTVWLATTLFRNGALFLSDVFSDNPEMAEAVNRLLVVGFYMLNLGWAFLIIRTDTPATGAEAVENLAMKLGMLLFSLGVIHFVNLWIFSRIRRGRRHEQVPPVAPTYGPQPAFAASQPAPPPAQWAPDGWATPPQPR